MDVLLNKIDEKMDKRLKLVTDEQTQQLKVSFEGINKSLENLNRRMETQEKKQQENAKAIQDLQERSAGSPAGNTRSSGRVLEAWKNTSTRRDAESHVWAVKGIGDDARIVHARVVHTVEQNVGGKTTQGAQLQEIDDSGAVVGENFLVENEMMFDNAEEALPALQRAAIAKRTRTHTAKR